MCRAVWTSACQASGALRPLLLETDRACALCGRSRQPSPLLVAFHLESDTELDDIARSRFARHGVISTHTRVGAAGCELKERVLTTAPVPSCQPWALSNSNNERAVCHTSSTCLQQASHFATCVTPDVASGRKGGRERAKKYSREEMWGDGKEEKGREAGFR
eukprot:170401-Chlamydomonas_euryale.AAC.1